MKTYRLLLTLSVCITALLTQGCGSLIAHAEKLQKARQEADAEARESEWLDKIMAKASSGGEDALDAMDTLSTHYRTGSQKDYAKALEWSRKAADLGHSHSQWILGSAYEGGEYGLSQDYVKAREWYEKSADKPGFNTSAMNSLGKMYYEGLGVEKNYRKALDHYRWCCMWEAARGRQGWKGVSSYLGMAKIFAKGGFGVQKDTAKAYSALRSAYSASEDKSQRDLVKMHIELLKLDEMECDSQNEEADGRGGREIDSCASESLALLLAKAEKGDAAAQFVVGSVLSKTSFGEGAKWYHKAAEQGHAPSQLMIGLMLARGGEGVKQDKANGIKWVLLAAGQDHLLDFPKHFRDATIEKGAKTALEKIPELQGAEDRLEGEKRAREFRANLKKK